MAGRRCPSHLILFWRTAAITKTEAKPAIVAVKEPFAKSPDGLREIVRAAVQEMLEAEMKHALGPGRAVLDRAL